MSRDGRTSPIAVFAAVTRAVREESMPEEVRARAFAALERMAAHLGLASYEEQFQVLRALAGEHNDLKGALAPHWPARAMAALSSVLNNA
jgi:hypothetical protein